MQDPDPNRELIAAAREVAAHAYAPYSNFRVGAAVLAGGKIYVGCNVENASYGLTVCAERNAIGAAVAAGHSALEAVAIFTQTQTPTYPCGACLQAIAEFAPDEDHEIRIHLACASGPVLSPTLAELLPKAFRKGALGPDGA